MHYWHIKLFSESARRELDVVLTMAEARNLKCAMACTHLFEQYSPRLVVLTGIAAGIRERVKIGDVIAADVVFDYGPARLEPGRVRRRPDPQVVSGELVRELRNFEPEEAGWHNAFRLGLKSLRRNGSVPRIQRDWRAQLSIGAILSGDFLFADGTTLETLRDQISENARAGEQEGSGFATTCEEHKVAWCIFRGISDFGDPKTKALKKKQAPWKRVAALSATTAARLFLVHCYADDLFQA
jgi:nucleoside phosphorylase